ncbi:MAG: hypothetical protein ACYS18_07805 [Planctomycetota bacterium]|jgi:hypothetical protein
MYEFSISEKHLKRGYWWVVMFSGSLWLFSFVFILYLEDFVFTILLFKVWGKLSLLLAVIVGIELPLMFRILRKGKVLIDEEKLIKQGGRKQEAFVWGDIAKIKLQKAVDGSLLGIKVYGKHGKTILLGGYNEMEKIAALTREKVSNEVLFQERQYSLNWLHPAYGIAAGVVGMMFISLIFQLSEIFTPSEEAVAIFIISLSFAVGSMLLIFRPLTKANLSFKTFEIISVAVLMILGISLSIVYFFYF